jgi:hypothetical protein
MALIRKRTVVPALERLVSDLPKLLLNLHAVHEQSSIDRERLKASEDKALAELMLTNLNMQMEMELRNIETDKDKIDAINTEYQQTTSFLPSSDSINASSSFNAEEILGNISQSYTGNLRDGIEERVDIASGIFKEGAKYEAIREVKEKDLKVLRHLKANMAQNLADIAAEGGDPYMVEPTDLASYWDETLLPTLKDQGMIPTYYDEDVYEKGYEYDQQSIDKYKDVWSGMLAPFSTRAAQRKDIVEFKMATTKQLLNEANIVDLHWNALGDKDKQEVLDDVTKRLSSVLSTQINAMDSGMVGKLGESQAAYVAIVNDDKKAQKYPHDQTRWDEGTRNAWTALQNKFNTVGHAISGIPNTGSGNEFNTKLGKEALAALMAVTKKDRPSEKLLMDFFAKVDLFINFEATMDDQGRMTFKKDEQGNRITRDIKRRYGKQLESILGLNKSEIKGGLLRDMRQLWEWKLEKDASRIQDALKPFNQVEPTGSIDIPGGTYIPRPEQEEYIDMAVGDIINSAQNEWII